MEFKKLLTKRNIILFVLLLYGIHLTFSYSKAVKGFDNFLPLNKSVSGEYLSLFTDDAQRSLAPLISYPSKVKNTMSVVRYRGNVDIFIYKINLATAQPLSKLLTESSQGAGRITDVATNVISKIPLRCEYMVDKVAPAANIVLQYKGTDFETSIKNDSAAGYSLMAEKLSLKYDPEGVIDLYCEASRERVPMQVLFVNRGQSTYLLIMSPNYPNKELEPQLLNTITLAGVKPSQ